MNKGKDRSERSGLFFDISFFILPTSDSRSGYRCARCGLSAAEAISSRNVRGVQPDEREFPLMKHRITVQICRFLHS